MALKSADDKSKRLVLLEELQRSPALDLSQKKWLREELMRTRRGIQGERESAHYLDHYFNGTENNVLLHDLRFVIDGEVTQIDHLILNRAGSVYLLETKNYACNLVINERGNSPPSMKMPALASRHPSSKACAMKKCWANCLSGWALWGAPRSTRIFITWSCSIPRRRSSGRLPKALTPPTSSRPTSFPAGTKALWTRLAWARFSKVR